MGRITKELWEIGVGLYHDVREMEARLKVELEALSIEKHNRRREREAMKAWDQEAYKWRYRLTYKYCGDEPFAKKQRYA